MFESLRPWETLLWVSVSRSMRNQRNVPPDERVQRPPGLQIWTKDKETCLVQEWYIESLHFLCLSVLLSSQMDFCYSPVLIVDFKHLSLWVLLEISVQPIHSHTQKYVVSTHVNSEVFLTATTQLWPKLEEETPYLLCGSCRGRRFQERFPLILCFFTTVPCWALLQHTRICNLRFIPLFYFSSELQRPLPCGSSKGHLWTVPPFCTEEHQNSP